MLEAGTAFPLGRSDDLAVPLPVVEFLYRCLQTRDNHASIAALSRLMSTNASQASLGGRRCEV